MEHTHLVKGLDFSLLNKVYDSDGLLYSYSTPFMFAGAIGDCQDVERGGR